MIFFICIIYIIYISIFYINKLFNLNYQLFIMSWYVLDAIDIAINRTKKCLFQPFEFWKWLRIAIILLFVGGTPSFGGSYGGNFPSQYNTNSSYDVNILNEIGSISETMIVLTIIGFFIFLLIFMYISSVMEFVLVDILVSNDVKLNKFKIFMGKGLELLIIRIIALFISFLILMALILPIIYLLLVFDLNNFGYISLIIVFALILIMMLVLIFGILNSFISLSIPISIYKEIKMFDAIKTILLQFKKSWQQMLVYWIGRIILSVAIGLMATIVITLGLLLLLLPLVVIGYIFYIMLNPLSGLTFIIAMILVAITIILIFFSLLFLSVPFGVFTKYHLLSFLELWYMEVKIPFNKGIDYKNNEKL